MNNHLLMRKNHPGFTLIELLVVIAIFALIANVTMISLDKAKRESRDAKRMSDVNQLRSALHLYSTDRLSYPAGANEALGVGANKIIDRNGFSDGADPQPPVFMTDVPRDPRMIASASGSPCTAVSTSVCDYGYTNTGTNDFEIYFFLEGTVGDKGPGLYRATKDLILPVTP